MERSGFSLATDCKCKQNTKNIQSLKHYLSAPTHEEKRKLRQCSTWVWKMPILCAKTKRTEWPTTTKNNQKQNAIAPKMPNHEDQDQNIPPENCLVPMCPDDSDSNASSIMSTPKATEPTSKIFWNNQMRQSSHMFSKMPPSRTVNFPLTCPNRKQKRANKTRNIHLWQFFHMYSKTFILLTVMSATQPSGWVSDTPPRLWSEPTQTKNSVMVP